MSQPKKRRRPESEEERFLAAYDSAEFPHPSVAVDVVLLTAAESSLHTVLLRRDGHPHRGKWALPGGFVGMRESLEEAVDRVLAAKAGIEGVFTEQLFTFGAPDRDPRTRVISVAYYALVDHGRLTAACPGNGDVRVARLDVPWPGLEGGGVLATDRDGASLSLAFDHDVILGTTVKRLRGKLDYAPIGFELLPQRFTLRQLQAVHEAVLGRTVNKDSFRRRMLASGLVVATGKREEGVLHRPAELFRFTRSPRA
jgi:8-oxo-dGTP diphosphatase